MAWPTDLEDLDLLSAFLEEQGFAVPDNGNPPKFCSQPPASPGSEQPTTSSMSSVSEEDAASAPSRRERPLLWVFLLRLLLRGEPCVQWHDCQPSNPGVFKFNDSAKAARLWGKEKGFKDMSYDKMSRSMRAYASDKASEQYRGVMQPLQKRSRKRLHFAFNLDHPLVAKLIRKEGRSHYMKLMQDGVLRKVDDD